MSIEQTKQMSTPNCLLDLPDAIISQIATVLTAVDKMQFMAACKATFRLTVPTEEITLRITKDSKYANISKVLDSFPAKLRLEIICPPDLVEDALPINSSQWPAVAVMITPYSHLGPAPSNHCWDMVTKITIQALRHTLMRCLMPQFIAVACPQLAQLAFVQSEDDISDDTFNIFTSKHEDSLPLTPCTSLKQLQLCVEASECKLPPAYHSPAELRRNLPNIDSFICIGTCNETLVEAFATQLTHLEIRYDSEYEPDNLCHCSNLQKLVVNQLFLPDNPVALRALDLLTCYCSDDDISKLLQLPNLTTLRMKDAECIQQDWSSHACPWQELHFEILPSFTTLANLNLSSLKTLSVRHDLEIRLPDPDDPSSLAAVRRAADNLAHVGHMVLGGRDPKQDTSFGRSGSVYWHVHDSDNEEAAAELIRVAAQQIAPVSVCNCQNLVKRPLLLNAVLDWGRDFLQSVCVGSNYNLAESVWQALQQLPCLETVVFWPDRRYDDEAHSNHGEAFRLMLDVVVNAAQHYVIPADKILRVEFGQDFSAAEQEYLTTGNCQVMHNLLGIMLPAGSNLISAEFVCMSGDERFTYYGGGCTTSRFWTFLVG